MRRLKVVAMALCVVASMGKAQGTSLAVSAGLPVGKMADGSGTGFGISLRDDGALPWWQLDYRVDLGFDYFGGHAGGATQQFTSIAFNVVQRPSQRLYEFGGFGLYNSKTSRAGGYTRNASNIGVQGGVGYSWDARREPFVEFGATNVFTTGNSSPWFVMRVGARF